MKMMFMNQLLFWIKCCFILLHMLFEFLFWALFAFFRANFVVSATSMCSFCVYFCQEYELYKWYGNQSRVRLFVCLYNIIEMKDSLTFFESLFYYGMRALRFRSKILINFFSFFSSSSCKLLFLSFFSSLAAPINADTRQQHHSHDLAISTLLATYKSTCLSRPRLQHPNYSAFPLLFVT